MIEWGNVPAGSVASLYWPQVHASDVLALAKTFYGVSPLGMSDANTIRIPITRGVSYVPIPAGAGENFAGLITIDLPTGVHSGQVFDVTVKRLGTRIGKTVPPPPQAANSRRHRTPQRTRRATASPPKADPSNRHATYRGGADRPMALRRRDIPDPHSGDDRRSDTSLASRRRWRS